MNGFSIFSKFFTFLTTMFTFCAPTSAAWFKSTAPSEKIFRRCMGSVGPCVVPGYHIFTVQKDVIEDCSEGLIKYDSNGRIIPGAAERWEISKDGLRWTFFLRKNAYYSDGQQVTAKDFVETLHRNFKNAPYYSQIEGHLTGLCVRSSQFKNASEILSGNCAVEQLGVRALDRFILEIELEQALNKDIFLAALAQPAVLVPVRQEYFDAILGPDPFREDAVYPSNGPFFIDKIRPGEAIELKKNPYYWNAKKVKLDKVIYLVSDLPQQASKWFNKEIDYLVVNKPALKAEISKGEPTLRWHALAANAYAYFILNENGPCYKKKFLREAFALTLNRDHLRYSCFSSSEEPIYGPSSPYDGDFKCAQPEWARLSLEERYQRARNLLQKEGYSQDNPVMLRLITYLTGAPLENFKEHFEQLNRKVPELKIVVQRLEVNDACTRIYNDRDQSYDIALIAKNTSFPCPFSRFKMMRGELKVKDKAGTCECAKIRASCSEATSQFTELEKIFSKKASPELAAFYSKIIQEQGNDLINCLPWCKNHPQSKRFNQMILSESLEVRNLFYGQAQKLYSIFSAINKEDVFTDEFDLLLQRLIRDDSLTTAAAREIYARLDEIVVTEWPVVPICTFPVETIHRSHVKGIDLRRRDRTGRLPSEVIDLTSERS